MSEPLIYTSRGNLPVSSLVYATRWEETDAFIRFVETYTLDGEVVRESSHFRGKTGLTMGAELGKLG